MKHFSKRDVIGFIGQPEKKNACGEKIKFVKATFLCLVPIGPQSTSGFEVVQN